jgi:Ca2+-transporting ATPase
MTVTTGKERRGAARPWHRASAEEVAAGLEVDLHRGLGRDAAAARLRSCGPNQLVEPPRRSPLRMLLGQFADFMILVLLAAALISGIVGSLHDATAIIVIVALNAVVGAVQEYRADRAVAALRSMVRPEARLLREGELRSIPAREVVVGDVVLLEAGNVVPADLRLVECLDLEIDEAPLTGESLPVAKITQALEAEQAPLGDRRNMAYKGTLAARGRGRGVVVATGMRTEFGRIAALMAEAEPLRTPLQRRLARFGRRLAVIVLCICALILGSGLLRGEPLLLMFLTAVSLAVAAIPEALPAVVTVSLALGARKMIRRRALVRRLPAVEALGSVTTICADKTGTLTQNRMAVENIFAAGRLEPGIPAAAAERWPWRRLGQGLALCNDIAPPLEPDAAPLAGDPTELSLYRAAQEAGFHKQVLLDELPLAAELPFDPERKRMSTLHRTADGALVFTKGAPEAVLAACTGQATGSGEVPLDPDAWLERAEGLASQGYRVLALAFRETGTFPETLGVAEVERSLTLLGLVALLDPPREEAAAAVSDCRSAGITPVMITGDHPGTALAIAQRLGFVSGESRVVTGSELTRIPMEQLERQVEKIRIYARVDPEQKTKIVEALQHRGHFVAMTGDGVNDAPALKRADIGVAMGQKGTDVAREAADMVLMDDDFATIVAAVREGRRIFDNIRKFIKYTMTSNSGEIWTLLLAPFLGLPIPLLPIHILWINLVTDGLPGLAFSAERAEAGIMRRPPRPPHERIFAGGMWQHMLGIGLLIGGLSILSQAWALGQGSTSWQTLVFSVLTFCQLAHALASRSESEPIRSIGPFSNPYLLGAVALTVGLQLAVIYLPTFQSVFKTQPLTASELLLCMALPLVVFAVVATEKNLMRRGILYRNRVAASRATGC